MKYNFLNLSEENDLVISQNEDMKTALTMLESSTLKLLIVTSEDQKFQGVITDGDIRTALLNGCELSTKIQIFKNSDCITVADEEELFNVVYQNKGISEFPCVNSSGEVQGLFVKKQPGIKPDIECDLAIMAGGKGTRLRPHTEQIPKPMLKVQDRPILEHIIVAAKLHGITNIYISVGYLGDVIKDYFGFGEKWEVKIEYIDEVEPMGTAGSLKFLPDYIRKTFFVINGDVISNINYSELFKFHTKNSSIATMCTRQHIIENQFGVVEVNNGKVRSFEEKPTYKSIINAGIYCLNKEVLDTLDGKYIDMPEVLMNLIKVGHDVFTYHFVNEWLDIGRIGDWEAAQNARIL